MLHYRRSHMLTCPNICPGKQEPKSYNCQYLRLVTREDFKPKTSCTNSLNVNYLYMYKKVDKHLIVRPDLTYAIDKLFMQVTSFPNDV